MEESTLAGGSTASSTAGAPTSLPTDKGKRESGKLERGRSGLAKKTITTICTNEMGLLQYLKF